MVKLQEKKDRLTALQKEEAFADKYLRHVQEMLRSMSEDESCKR